MGKNVVNRQKGGTMTNKSQIFIAFYMRPNIFRQKSKYIRSPFYIKYGTNKV